MRKLLVFIVVCQLVWLVFLIEKIYKSFNGNLLLRNNVIAYLPVGNVLSLKENQDLPYFYENIPNTKKLSSATGFTAKSIQNINADGLNERYDYSLSKPQGVFRIITLGDSFTEGVFVETKDNYPERLEDILNKKLECNNISKFEVINLAVLGYDIEYGINRFRSKGAKYNPDLVTWLIKEDDFINVNKYMSVKRHSYEEKFRQSSPDEIWLRVYNETLKEYGEGNLIKYQYEKLSKFLDSLGSKALLFTYKSAPAKIKMLLKLLVQNDYDRYSFALEETSHFPDGHPDILGHQRIAEQIFNYLVKQKIIPCRLKED